MSVATRDDLLDGLIPSKLHPPCSIHVRFRAAARSPGPWRAFPQDAWWCSWHRLGRENRA